MKKQYIFLLASAFFMLIGISSVLKAQVTGMPVGYITGFPVISTAQSPVWYNLMTSNYGTNIEQRRNRFMFWDGVTLGSDKLDSGISAENQNDKYLWRLEQGSTTNDETHKYVYLVNKSTGLRISDLSGIITMAEQGTEVKLGTSQEIKDLGLYTSEIPVAGQHYMQYTAASTLSYLNMSATYTIIWFNAHPSVTKSSGWFFYPAATNPTQVETVKKDLLHAYPSPFNNKIQIDKQLQKLEKVEIFNMQGAKVLSEIINPYTLNTTVLVPGLYVVKAYAAGNVYSTKLMKSGSN
jgi:hypothetical protein